MKHLLLSAIACIAATSAMAQPTLTAATTNPIVGDVFYGHNCDATGVSKGLSGAGVTWNLASLTEVFADTTTYVACASTPYCSTFPGSTLAIDYGMSYYEYYVADANKLAVTGEYQPGSNVYFSDPACAAAYPMTYNTVILDTYSYTQPSFSLIGYGLDSLIGDAYGTLILPSGSYTNVLRVHFVSISHDTDNSSTPPVIDSMRTDIYNWYTTGFHNPILTMQYDSTGGTSSLTNVEYFTAPAPPTPSAITNLNDTRTMIRVYPNPATDNIHILFTAAANRSVSISVSDMVGRTIGNVTNENVTTGINDIMYSVASLSPGVYMLRIQSEGNSQVQKIQVGR